MFTFRLARGTARRGALSVLGGVVLSLLLAGQAGASTADLALNGLARTARAVLATYMSANSASDPRYYLDGTWHATDGPDCWYCYDAAATGAATLSQQPDGDQQLRNVAVDTFNTAIAKYQLRNGAFADPYPTPDGIGTGFFTVDLGISYLELQRSLDHETRTAWAAAIAKAADYLIKSAYTEWYTNGNVDLRQTEVMWLAWTITHERRFLSTYNAEWAFTTAPDHKRWPGFGLRITRRPSRSDGSDGSGYLAESGGGAPGFDPAYTGAQLDTATDLYVLTRDPRYLRLMNLLFNQLRPLISADWILNATRGTRTSYMTPFMSAAVSVLAASGDRPDLAPSVARQLALVEAQYTGAKAFTHVNFYKGFEGWLSMPLLNRQWPQGMAPDEGVAVPDTRVRQARRFGVNYRWVGAAS